MVLKPWKYIRSCGLMVRHQSDKLEIAGSIPVTIKVFRCFQKCNIMRDKIYNSILLLHILIMIPIFFRFVYQHPTKMIKIYSTQQLKRRKSIPIQQLYWAVKGIWPNHLQLNHLLKSKMKILVIWMGLLFWVKVW